MTMNGSAASTSAGFSAAAPAEHVIVRLRRHGRMLFWPCLLLIVVVGLVSYFVGRLPEEWENIAVLAGGALLVVVGFLLPLFAWLNRRYTITTRRLIVRHGFFVHVRQEVMHSRGYGLSVRRSWLQSAFRSGDVVIEVGEGQAIVLRDVPNADLVMATLHELMATNQLAGPVRRPGEPPIAPDDHTVVWGER